MGGVLVMEAVGVIEGVKVIVEVTTKVGISEDAEVTVAVGVLLGVIVCCGRKSPPKYMLMLSVFG